MILIDSVYIHSSGGKTLLETLINSINRDDLINYWFLFDSRFDENYIKSLKAGRTTILNASEFQRRKFYKKNQDKFKSVFCFSNVPPPISVNKRVVIYLQNDLLLSSKNSALDLRAQLILSIKKTYISFLNKKNYLWAVQTILMKEKLMNSLRIESDNIEVYPFFEELNYSSKVNFKENSFLYVAGSGKHKNHKRLIIAFNQAANKSKAPLTLKLTLPKEAFSSLTQNLPNTSPNLRLINLGELTKEQVLKSYQETRFLIYPSLKESFGLPLIEAAQLGVFVIASELPFVSQVIKPSLSFNPYLEIDIAKVVLKAVNLKNTPKTIINVKNKVNSLLKLISYDVQK
jgi:glycosyltransferase involved in cell wall biosynthesis